MSELKTLLAEAKSSLQDLENLLQRARSLDQATHDERGFSREEIQGYFEEILKIVERIPENLKIEETLGRKDEIQRLHVEMENVRHRVEDSIGLLEAICERNVKQLADFVDTLQQRFTSITQEGQVTAPMSQLNELLTQGKAYLEGKDYEACMRLMNEALYVAPSSREAASCLEEAQRKWEDQRLEEELVIHIENLKKDATDLFGQEKYKDCVGMFKFLCELEPKNRTLQDYLELSQQKLQEAEDASELQQREMNLSGGLDLESSTAPLVAVAVTSQERSLQAVFSGDADRISSWVEGSERVPASGVKSQTTLQSHYPDSLSSPQENLDEELTDASETPASKKSLFAVLGVIVVVVGMLAGGLLLHKPKPVPVGNLEIQSEPSGARVFVNGELRGETKLSLESMAVGQYQLRLEKEGYAPLSQAFTIDSQKPSSLEVRLLKIIEEQPVVSVEKLEEAAGEFFDRGKLLNANQQCNIILERDHENAMAAALKGKIRDRYWQQSQLAQRRGRPEEARTELENLLKVSPRDMAAIRELRALKTKAKKSNEPALSEEARLRGRIEELRRQITAATRSGSYFPPDPGNAFQLVQQLGELSPTDTTFKEKMDQLHRESISQLQRKIQSKDIEGAKTLARQFQNYFPASAELKSLRDSLRADESRQLEVRNTLLQKLDSVMARGNYVTPPNENALAYCNRLLAMDGPTPKIQALKREALTRAASQSQEFIANEKFDDARETLSALLGAAQSENRPNVVQDLKSQLGKIEFVVFPVVHDHTLGSCSGRLKMNAYVIAYLASGDAKDGFSQKLSDVGEVEGGDKLKVQLKNKTYRFQPSSAKNKEETRQKIEEIYQKLTGLTRSAK